MRGGAKGGGWLSMLIAALVTLLGVLIGVLGIFHADMYDIGVMVTFLGLIGIVVRLGDWLRWLRR